MSAHTPGPWVADLHIYPVMVSSQSETWPLVDELGNEEGRAGSFICNTGNNKANARLIAAAPELLSVAQELSESAEYWSEYDVPLGIVDRIRSAIAKAIGVTA